MSRPQCGEPKGWSSLRPQERDFLLHDDPDFFGRVGLTSQLFVGIVGVSKSVMVYKSADLSIVLALPTIG
jgi:hypothetical protein